MFNFIKYIVIFLLGLYLIGCSKEDDTSKTSFQILADKEKELNDREARIKLKEIELEERERRINTLEGNLTENASDTSSMELSQNQKDSLKIAEKQTKSQKKKEIQKEITKKFENPSSTVKDYYEYIQRGIYETGNFESNMKKAQTYFPSRSVETLKAGYRNTKQFTVEQEPKVLSQKDDKATVVAKVKQTQVIKNNGDNKEVTKTLTVTYNLTANQSGEWVIVGNLVKED
ncbi:MAG: hypothetical protein L0Y79_00955 [Chlorobi bacterium]|nr:hypothetical protein [Chlorobiota bacterium]MCI0716698.1 hypothetical protein [Chlorobiota bacterium]